MKTAQESHDQLSEFVIMAGLGQHITGQNLSEGLKMQYQAYDLYTLLQTSAHFTETVALNRHLHRLQGWIGIAEFDNGQYDKAEKWLKESTSGLRKLSMYDELCEDAQLHCPGVYSNWIF